jgi:hypothetical protein
MKQQMRWITRWVALLLCLVLTLGVLCLVSCNGDTTADGGNTNVPADDATTDPVGDPSDGPSDGPSDTPANIPSDVQNNNPIAPGLMAEGQGLALVNADGTPRFVRVIRGELAKEKEKQAAILARKTLNSVLGVSMAILEDYATDSEWDAINNTYEILVGDTNRPETKEALADLGEDQFVIRMTDKKLVYNIIQSTYQHGHYTWHGKFHH